MTYPQSVKRKNMMTLCHEQQAVVQQAITAFEDPSISDADVGEALWTAGNSCVGATNEIPAFVGSYGQWIGHYVWQALGDGGASLREALIIGPGQFQFTGIYNDVGPYILRDRLEGLVGTLNDYRAQIDEEEATQVNSGGVPTHPSEGTTDRIGITLTQV